MMFPSKPGATFLKKPPEWRICKTMAVNKTSRIRRLYRSLFMVGERYEKYNSFPAIRTLRSSDRSSMIHHKLHGARGLFL
jgi:hypothetical protein